MFTCFCDMPPVSQFANKKVGSSVYIYIYIRLCVFWLHLYTCFSILYSGAHPRGDSWTPLNFGRAMIRHPLARVCQLTIGPDDTGGLAVSGPLTQGI